MSASVPPPAPGATPDPSMEDILASIRRILSEDEQPEKSAAGEVGGEPEVVALDESMLVAEPTAELVPIAEPHPAPPPAIEPAAPQVSVVLEPPPAVPIAMPLPLPAAPDRLIAPEAEAAATNSVSSLLRTLEAGRNQGGMAVHRGGPTLEDIVREEMRPLLKAWLDSNLPPLVERLVRAEIERLVGRALS